MFYKLKELYLYNLEQIN